MQIMEYLKFEFLMFLSHICITVA